MEFLVHMMLNHIPRMELREREAVRARELADLGILVRLWWVPGSCENWGIWRAKDAGSLHEVLASLPTFPYLLIHVHPLTPHPNDPQMVLTPGEMRGRRPPMETETDF